MLYNGSRKWNYPNNINNLIHSFDDSRQFNPDFQFYPFYLNELSTEKINKRNDGLAFLLKLERSIILPETIKEVIRDQVNIDSSNKEVVKLINLWLIRVLEGKRISPNDLEAIYDFEPKEEDEPTMLTEALNNYYEEAVQKGIWQGKQEGLTEGKRETARNLLIENSSPEFVVKVTGLEKKDVLELQKSLQQEKI